jgi:hypothetical protein
LRQNAPRGIDRVGVQSLWAMFRVLVYKHQQVASCNRTLSQFGFLASASRNDFLTKNE